MGRHLFERIGAFFYITRHSAHRRQIASTICATLAGFAMTDY